MEGYGHISYKGGLAKHISIPGDGAAGDFYAARVISGGLEFK
jgi:hypothetical protein